MDAVANRIALAEAITSLSRTAASVRKPGFLVAASGPQMGNGVAAAAAASLLGIGFEIIDARSAGDPSSAVPGVPMVLLALGGDKADLDGFSRRYTMTASGTVVVLAVGNLPVEHVATELREFQERGGFGALVATCHR